MAETLKSKRPGLRYTIPRFLLLLAMPDYVELMKRRTDESEKMSEKASEAFDNGSKANLISDNYGFLTVMFSTVMFLSASQQNWFVPKPGFYSLCISALICIAVLLLTIFSMPIGHRG